jgi:hypothetical protein
VTAACPVTFISSPFVIVAHQQADPDRRLPVTGRLSHDAG